ncbi:26818_t:CDS:1, partial [Racocetra persica]
LDTILAQKDDLKKEYIVVFTNRSFIKAKQNYTTTKLECLADLWAIKYFHYYFGLDL